MYPYMPSFVVGMFLHLLWYDVFFCLDVSDLLGLGRLEYGRLGPTTVIVWLYCPVEVHIMFVCLDYVPSSLTNF
jgi:hypothetical protein